MATIIKTKNLPQGFQTILSNGRHSVLADEPTKSGGTDLGFSPSDLLLSSLAMCKVATVRYIARKKGWEIGEVEAELEQEVKRTKEGLKTNIKVKLNIEGDLSAEQKAELFKQADACYIHRQILGEWNIEHATDAEIAELNKVA